MQFSTANTHGPMNSGALPVLAMSGASLTSLDRKLAAKACLSVTNETTNGACNCSRHEVSHVVIFLSIGSIRLAFNYLASTSSAAAAAIAVLSR